MKEFIILLVLLLLISTFGGSLRYKNTTQEVVGVERYQALNEYEDEEGVPPVDIPINDFLYTSGDTFENISTDMMDNSMDTSMDMDDTSLDTSLETFQESPHDHIQEINPYDNTNTFQSLS
jgi:hypothetical protein